MTFSDVWFRQTFIKLFLDAAAFDASAAAACLERSARERGKRVDGVAAVGRLPNR